MSWGWKGRLGELSPGVWPQSGLWQPKDLSLSPWCQGGFGARLGLVIPWFKASARWQNREEKKYKQELQQGAWGNGNAHHLNNAFLAFTQVLLLSSKQKTLHSGLHSFLQLSTTCLWLYDGCTISSSPIFLCSIIPDQILSEISLSCKNGLII